MNGTYLRGEMYYADLGEGIGSEQNGKRPVVIIQNDVGNRYSSTVIVAAISSQRNTKAKLPTHYCLEAENGLEVPSVILLEQLRTIDKRRLGRFVGRLDKKYVNGMDHALAISLNLVDHVQDAIIINLCGACAENFRNVGAYSLHRVDPHQSEKEICTYCGRRRGYDYIVSKKQAGGK